MAAEEELNLVGDDDVTDSDQDEAGTKSTEPAEDSEALKAKLAELERESKGRLRTIQAQRQAQRQYEAQLAEMKGKMDALVDILNQAKSKSSLDGVGDDQDLSGIASDQSQTGLPPLQTPQSEPGKAKIPVQFDEQGNPFIDQTQLQGLLNKYSQSLSAQDKAIYQQLQALQQQQQAAQYYNSINSTIQRVVTSDPAYTQAFGTLTQAFQYLDQSLNDLVTEKQMNPQSLTLSTATELLASDPRISKEFAAKFPGLDIDSVIDAMSLDPQGNVQSRKLRNTLEKIKTASAPSESPEKNKIKTLQALASKPSSLAGTPSTGKEGTSLDDIANLSVDDFINLSDADIKRIEKVLASEEQNAG